MTLYDMNEAGRKNAAAPSQEAQGRRRQQCAVLRYEMLLNLSCTARRAPSAGSPRRRVHEGV